MSFLIGAIIGSCITAVIFVAIKFQLHVFLIDLIRRKLEERKRK